MSPINDPEVIAEINRRIDTAVERLGVKEVDPAAYPEQSTIIGFGPPLVEEHHFAGYDWRLRFPNATQVCGSEGTVVCTAEDAVGHWVIIDSGTLADLLHPVEDADMIAELVSLRRFATRGARDEWIAEQFSRPVEMRLSL